MVEYENSYNGRTIEYTYSEGDGYPLMRLSYLDETFQGYFEDGADKIIVDASYFYGRSIVTFANRIEELDEDDKGVVSYFVERFKDRQLEDMYKHKILVKEGEREYWILLPEDLIEYLEKDAEILVKYFAIGSNGRLSLLGVDYRDQFLFFSSK